MNTSSNTDQVYRLGGIANIIGGVLVAVAYLGHPHAQTSTAISGTFWLIVHVLFVFSLLFGIFGLFALMGYTIHKTRIGGTIGYVLAITSLIFIFGMNYYETFINPV
ncbi:MAG: hypothetical protein HKN08_01040, partial [Gammaproteobacteria bacterium]|nr:hypothetical protein [Gammaproteobacteria bacterium]